MFVSSLSRLAARKGWKKNDTFLYRGEINGCPVTLVDGEGFIEIILSLPGLEEGSELWDGFCRTIDAYSGLTVLRRSAVDGFLDIRIRRRPLSMSVTADSLDLFLNILISHAADGGLIAPRVCVVCGQPAEELGTLYDLSCYVHPSCKEEEGDRLPYYPPYLMYENAGKDPYRSMKVRK
ncbi:MAG: hypothetical protein KBA30_00515 [Clostridia bacterium]|nr:hypothetical protein [Clostridia bacterium]